MQTSSIQKTLHEQLQRYPTETLVIACSGGVDSIVLLHEISHLVNTLKIHNKIIVCYVDHGLSQNAVNWHDFVKTQCSQLSLSFVGKKVVLDKSLKQSLEAQAREARYGVLKEVANTNGVVITAHHQDDQVETFLLALKRGAGIKGLSAMTVHSTLLTVKGELPLVRPLLSISRHTIEERAKVLALDWVEDESNLDQQFDRNFLRQTVVPLLSQRWAGIGQAIARAAGHCQDAQHLLDEVASNDLQQCLTTDNHLSVEQLLTLSDSRFNYVLRYFLAQNNQLMPSSHVLLQVKQQLLAENDKTPQVKIGSKWFRRFQNKLILTDDFAELSNWQQTIDIKTIINAPITVQLPDNLGKLVFSCADDLALNNDAFKSTTSEDALENINRPNEPYSPINDKPLAQGISLQLPENIKELSLAFSHANPICLPDYRQHSRPLKKVLQELEIAPWQRKRIPLLFHDDNLISALGHFICQPYNIEKTRAVANTIKINVRWLASDNSG